MKALNPLLRKTILAMVVLAVAFLSAGADAQVFITAQCDVHVKLYDATNYEGQPHTRVGWLASNNRYWTFMRFQLNDIIPPHTKIKLALLRVRVAGTTGSTPNQVILRRVDIPWNPATINGQVGNLPLPLGPCYDVISPPNAGAGIWNVTTLVQGWVNGTFNNHGIVLLPGAFPDWSYRFYALESAVPNTDPLLVVFF
jgi:hypothetical protein